MDLQVFNNFQFGEVTVITINNEPWFVAKEVAAILGYGKGNGNSKALANAIVDHVDEDDQIMLNYHQLKELFKRLENGDFKNYSRVQSLGNSHSSSGFNKYKNGDFNISKRGMKIINESGLYSLIFGSTLESAKKFKRWVTHDVLPVIRKTGQYGLAYQVRNDEYSEVDITISKALMVAKELLEKNNSLVRELREDNEYKMRAIEEAKPKLDYYNTILQSVNTIKTTQIAADYGLTARALNQILNEERVQYKVNKQWVLYAKYKNKGYTGSKSKIINRSNGTDEAIITTYWTQKGRLFIHKILGERGIVAVMDREKVS